jgi:antitoxin FitA
MGGGNVCHRQARKEIDAINAIIDSMASLTVRRIDEKVKAKLRVRAAMKGHSMEEEVREILTTAVNEEEKHGQPENLYTAIRRRLAEAGIDGVDLPEFERGPWREGPDFGK